MERQNQTPADQPRERKRPWTRPTVKYAGSVGDVFLAGGGKISTLTYDSGDTPFKPPGQG